MEVVTTKPFKTPSNISEIVSKFAKVCKFRSIGVFPSENPFHDNVTLVDESSDTTVETESNAEKVHPFPIETQNEKNVSCGDDDDSEIAKLFDIISALKSAYVKLQEAHIPHNAKKLIVADELFMAELESLCKLKRVYKEKRFARAKSKSSKFGLLQAEIGANEKLLRELKSEAKAKKSKVADLVNELKKLDVSNVKLGKKIKRVSLEREFAIGTVLNVTSLHNAFAAASKSIHDFAKPLISLMKASGWDLDRAVKAVEREAVYAKRSHKKYAFEAYIARRMFSDVLLGNFDVSLVMRFDDPIDALMEDPDTEFAKFCQEKYLLVVHPKMEASFFGNLDHRAFVSKGKHPRTPFYQIFARMAKWVWILQGMARSLDPKAKAFFVKRMSKFSDDYMESVVDEAFAVDQAVEFMVMPGFKVGDTMVKSRVYVSKIGGSNGMGKFEAASN